MKNKRAILKGRILLLLCTFAFAIFGLIAVLGYITIAKGNLYTQKAIESQTKDKMIAATRGTVYERNGKELAMNVTVYTVAVDAKYIKQQKQQDKVKTALQTVLKLDKKLIEEKLAQTQKSYVVVKKEVDQEEVDLLKELKKKQKIKGIVFEPKAKRIYPFGRELSHVIGSVIDSQAGLQGVSGLESYYNPSLAGIPGRIFGLIDSYGNQPIVFDTDSESEVVEPKSGYNIVTTIDEFIQSVAEQNLTETIKNFQAKAGTIIVMNPNTGEVYAMASYPELNNNNPESWNNYAVQQTYEPGSTFKVLTVAAALEDGVTKPTDQFVDVGYKVVSGVRINSWKAGGFGIQTLSQVLQNSSNVGVMDLAERLGPIRFNYYSRMFGLNEKTGIDLPGEEQGILHTDLELRPVELATSSFGQTFQVTPIQMITALAAAINGGNLMKPYLVSEVKDMDGNLIKKTEPTVVRKVISKETSDQIRDMMRDVVANGTGVSADLPGYRVGGKTGTSEKRPRNSGLRIASFVGAAPMEKPQVLALMVIDEPGTLEKGGSHVAAPAVGKIFEKILPYLGVKPILQEETDAKVPKTAIVGNYTNKDLQAATEQITRQNLRYIVKGVGNFVVNQHPKPGGKISVNNEIILYVSDEKEAEAPTTGNIEDGVNTSDTENHTQYDSEIPALVE